MKGRLIQGDIISNQITNNNNNNNNNTFVECHRAVASEALAEQVS